MVLLVNHINALELIIDSDTTGSSHWRFLRSGKCGHLVQIFVKLSDQITVEVSEVDEVIFIVIGAAQAVGKPFFVVQMLQNLPVGLVDYVKRLFLIIGKYNSVQCSLAVAHFNPGFKGTDC